MQQEKIYIAKIIFPRFSIYLIFVFKSRKIIEKPDKRGNLWKKLRAS